MAQNIVVGIFEVESEAYQALTQIKQYPGDDNSFVSEAALVKKENGTLRVLDSFDSGKDTTNDTMIGGLVGGLFGILGGPLGVLLMGSYGALIGNLLDTGDAIDNASLIEQIAGKLSDNDVAIIALAEENNEAILDSRFAPFKTLVLRYDADAVADEVEKAEEISEDMARQAREKLREKRLEDGKKKIDGWFKKKEEEYVDAVEKKAEVAFDNETVKEYSDNYD